MPGFQTERKAKEYLAGRIVAEAEREGSPLTDVERKMLYFTESGWTLPDMVKVSEEFDRDYDQEEYERKIGQIVRKIQAHDAAENGPLEAAWDDAVQKLCEGDHYLLVLIDAASGAGPGFSRLNRLGRWLPSSSAPARRPPGDLIRLLLVGLVVFAALFLISLGKTLLERLFR
jgi:hypothetical protein